MNPTAMSTPDNHSSQAIGLEAKAIVEGFLRIIMIPDPEGARAFVAPELEIHFTGDIVIEREAGDQRVADIRTAREVVIQSIR